MQDDEPARDAPDAGEAGDELRVEDLTDASVGSSELPQWLWGLWRRVNTHWRATRVMVSGVTALLALAVVLLASDGQPALATQIIASYTPSRVGTSPWERIALPVRAGESARLTPSPSDPATLFACTYPQWDPNEMGLPVGPLTAWRTRDAGAHWRSLPLPPLVGSWCDVRMAADAPSRITVLAGDGNVTKLYLSDDGGDSWNLITLPLLPLLSQPDVTILGFEVVPTAHHLFVQADYFQVLQDSQTEQGGGDRRELSTLARSDDQGRTWIAVGQELGSDVFFRPFVLGNGNTLIASVPQEGRTSSGSSVWLSRDAGSTWHLINRINDGWTTNLVTAPILQAAPDASVYAMLEEQIPSSLFRLKARWLTVDMSAWVAIPPLPVPGARPDRTGLLQIFEETSDGRLLAIGVDPHTGVPSESAMSDWTGTQAQWLWIWDQRIGRWLVSPSPLPIPYRWGCGVCLEHHATWALGRTGDGATALGTYLWLHDVLGHGLGDGTVAYRIFVPDAPPGKTLS